MNGLGNGGNGRKRSGRNFTRIGRSESVRNSNNTALHREAQVFTHIPRKMVHNVLREINVSQDSDTVRVD